MSEVVQEAHQEFWRPPSPAVADPIVFRQTIPTMAEACSRCGTEFLLGSGFCHSCGVRRPKAISAAKVDGAGLDGLWEQGTARFSSLYSAGAKSWDRVKFPSWVRYFQFHEIKNWVGLPTASLIAFVIGVGCVAGALLVGLLTARNFVDWQAIQFYRAEWLLAATASFVAGILLKKPGKDDRN
jgi:hypothetical protein